MFLKTMSSYEYQNSTEYVAECYGAEFRNHENYVEKTCWQLLRKS